MAFAQTFSGTVSSSTYDFSAIAVGDFPSNTSIFGFSTIDPSSTGTFQGVSSSMGNGFLVSTGNTTSAAYFCISVQPVTNNFTLNLSFFWNDSSNFAFTEDSVSIYSGSNMILNTSFGPEGGYLVRENGFSGKEVSADPPMNKLWNLTASYNDESGMYFGFGNGSTSILPIFYNSSLVTVSTITVLIGGHFSTAFLRSISVYDSSYFTCAVRSSSDINYTTSELQNFPSALNTLKGIEYDRLLNTVVGITENGSLLAYNLVNSTAFTLLNGSQNTQVYQVSSSDTSSSMYFVAENPNFTRIAVVSSSNLSTSSSVLDWGGNSPVSILPCNQHLLIFNSNETISDVNLSLGTTHTVSLPLSSGAQLLSANLSGDFVNTTWLSGSNLTDLEIFSGNASYTTGQRTRISSNSGEIYVIDNRSECGNITSILEYGLNSTVGIFSQSGLEPVPFASSVKVASSIFSSRDAIIDSEDSFHSVSGNELALMQGEIPDSQTIRACGNSTMLSTDNNSVFLSLPSGENTTTGTGVKLTVQNTYTMSGTEDEMNTSVVSGSQYSETASFANVTLSTSNGSLFLLNSSIQNGQYATLVYVENVQGYSASASCEIIIDRGNPEITTNIENGTYLSQSPTIRLNYSFWTQISSISLIVENSSMSLPSQNFSRVLNLSGFSGPCNMIFVMVDQFQVTHHYAFGVTVVPDQNGPFQINVVNGTYFNENLINLKWSSLNYSSLYYANISGSQNLSLSETSPGCDIDLGNGTFDLTVSGLLKDGVTVVIARRQFYVQTFGPGLVVTGNGSGYYSFLGNSPKDRFSLTAESNVSASLEISLTSPSGVLLYQKTAEDLVSFNASLHTTLFNLSGIYSLEINATGNSGISSVENFSLNVNNSIPALPFTTSKIYTNLSHIMEQPKVSGGCNYTITLLKSGIPILTETGSPLLVFSSGTGNYTANVTVFSEWGNQISQNLSIIYETESPVIALNTSYNGTEYLCYNITDSVSLRYIEINYLGNSIEVRDPAKQGKVGLALSKNAIINISVKVEDFCNNTASSNTTLDFQKLINISGYSITIYPILGFGVVFLHLHGQNTQNASVDWLFNGREYSGRSILIPFVGLGTHNFTCVVHYGNHTLTVTKKMFFIGWYPLVIGVLAVVSLILMRRLRQSTDSEEIVDFIGTMSGAPLKEIMKKAAKAGLKRKTVKATISDLRKTGEATMESDPDGVLYLFMEKK